MTLRLEIADTPAQCAIHHAPIKDAALEAIKATEPNATVLYCYDCRQEVLAAAYAAWLADVHRARGVA